MLLIVETPEFGPITLHVHSTRYLRGLPFDMQVKHFLHSNFSSVQVKHLSLKLLLFSICLWPDSGLSICKAFHYCCECPLAKL